MFVDDSCINSSFFLSILLFSIAPAIFANCPNLRKNNAIDTCIYPPKSIVNGNYLFDTAALINLDLGGPCEFHHFAYTAIFSKVDTDGRKIKVLFTCSRGNSINGNKELCHDMGRVKVKYNIKRPVDRDAFNFGLELVNFQPNDSGLYRYDATFFTFTRILQRLTKHFEFHIGEHDVYSYCLFLKDMISGE